MKMANELKLGKGKDFVKNRKKAICAGGLGILLLAGIGFGVSSLVNAETAKTKVSVSSGIASTYEDTENDEGVSTVQDQKENSKDEVTKESSTDSETVSKETGTEQATDKVETTGSETVSKESATEQATDKASTPQGTSTDSIASTENTSKGSSTPSTSQGSSTASKPSTPSTPSTSKGSSTPSTSETPSSGVSTPSHSHSWSPVTSVVNHEASGHWEDVVVKAAWSEEIPKYETTARDLCNTCNADITEANISAHLKKHMMAGEDKGGYRTAWKKVQVGTKAVNHPAVYDKKWVVDKQAWSETVTNGHKCSCGSTK